MPRGRRLATVAIAASTLSAAGLVAASTVLPPASALAPSPPRQPLRRVTDDAASAGTTTTTLPPAAPTPVPAAAPATTIATVDARPDALADPAVIAPVHVAVPAVYIDAAVAPTGVDDEGRLAIPDSARQLVWWRYGASPGAPGSAVIAGHVDWRGERGTFAFLRDVDVGDAVEVRYEDGRLATFAVTDVAIVDKALVPEVDTFRRDGEPLLRLITCGGAYDEGARSYLDNVVVTAAPA